MNKKKHTKQNEIYENFRRSQREYQIYYTPYQMKQAKNKIRREKIVVHADRIYNQFALKR